jgi:hypothetical protein
MGRIMLLRFVSQPESYLRNYHDLAEDFIASLIACQVRIVAPMLHPKHGLVD